MNTVAFSPARVTSTAVKHWSLFCCPEQTEPLDLSHFFIFSCSTAQIRVTWNAILFLVSKIFLLVLKESFAVFRGDTRLFDAQNLWRRRENAATLYEKREKINWTKLSHCNLLYYRAQVNQVSSLSRHRQQGGALSDWSRYSTNSSIFWLCFRISEFKAPVHLNYYG